MQEIYKAIAEIRKRTPWIGIVLQCLEMVETTRISTMATNGKQVFINIAFSQGLSDVHRMGVLVHESLHVIGLHMFRCKGRDPQRFNIAADHAINWLVEMLGYELPKGTLIGIDSTAEKLYQEPPQDFGEKSPDDSQTSGDSDESEDNTSDADSKGDDDSNTDDTSDDFEDSSTDNGSGIPDDMDSDSEASDSDSVSDDSDSGSESDSSADNGDSMDSDILEYPLEDGQTMADAEREVSDMIAKAQVMAKICGDEPTDEEKEIFELPEPVVDWAEELAEFINETGTSDYSMMPPNMVLSNSGIIANRLNPSGCGHVILIRDNSPSMDKEKLSQCEAEVESALDQIDYESIRVIDCNDHVNDDRLFMRGETIDAPVRTSGGTMFSPAFEYIEDMNYRPDLVIYFTDMEVRAGNSPEVEPDYPVCWAVYGELLDDDLEWKAPYGMDDSGYWFQPDWGHRIKIK